MTASSRRAVPRFSYDAYTAHHHLRAAVGLGMVAGIFVFNEYLVRKDLSGTRWHVLVLVLAPALAQFAAVVWHPLDPHRPLGRRPFRTIAIPAHLLLFLPLLGLLPREATPIVVLLAFATSVHMLLLPTQNRLLASNYAEATRGRRFGTATAVQAAVIVLVSLPAGWLLDHRPEAWPWIYAFAGVAGIWGYGHWSRMRRRRPRPPPAGVPEHRSPWAALRHDRAFLAFEGCFMLYGLGFLMILPVLPLYLVDEVGITYGQVGLARGAVFWTGMVLAAPLLGRLGDRIGILRLTALSFLFLASFPLTLVLVRDIVGVTIAFALFGVAMSGVFLAWTLGPMHFARRRDPLPYLNAHVGLVGVRALVGMVSATLIQQAFGSRTVFVCCVALEVLAGLGMILLARSESRRAEARNRSTAWETTRPGR